MTRTIEARVIRLERRHFDRTRGAHRYSDDELDSLIAWLKDPHPASEPWALSLLHREGLLR